MDKDNDIAIASELPRGVRWRLVFAILGGFGLAIIYGLKVNLSVAIVAMINHTGLKHQTNGSLVQDEKQNFAEKSCFSNSTDDSETSTEDGPFMWSELEQGLVLGSYFWGYLITQIPGGRLAEIFGGKWVFFGAVVTNIVATLLSPICSYADYRLLILMRIIEGLGGGFTFPAMNVLLSKWAPVEERSTMASIAYGGTALGTVISIATSGLIANSWGWEAVFYIHGGVSITWCIFWVIFVFDSPSEHKFISVSEQNFIQSSIGANNGNSKPKSVPWKKILSSTPVWAIVITHFLNNVGWYMLLVELPLFMRTGLGFNIKENAGLSCVPFLCNWIFSIIYSKSLDWARSKGYLSTVNARKISMGICSLIPAGCLIGVSLAGCDRTIAVALMVVATMFYGSMFSGVFSNHTDIANNYAGILMGLSNMVATIPGFIVPAFVGALTHGQEGLAPWHIVFYVTSAMLVLECIVFTLLASGTEQPWNKEDEEENFGKLEEMSHLEKQENQEL